MLFFPCYCGECNHPIHQAIQNKSEYQQENVPGNFGRFFGALAACLAVLLIPQKHDPYRLYLIEKVTNEALQHHIMQH